MSARILLSTLLCSSVVFLAPTTACKSKDATNGTTEPKGLPPTTDDAGTIAANDAAPFALKPARPLPPTPLGLPAAPSPDYNPTTAEKVALGAQLFAEVGLSVDKALACSSCHDPGHGFSSAEPLRKTATGSLNQRHTPSLINLAYHHEFYWDGRSTPLEAHILGHWQGQLGLAPEAAMAQIAELPLYQAHFERAFDSEPNRDRAAEALAAYVRSLVLGNSPWDRYEAGDASAVTADAIAGAAIFNQRAGCATCHAPPLYTDLLFHNLGLPQNPETPDLGRGGHTGKASDNGAFKTPGLRGVSRTSPYFHDGSAATLSQVLERKESQGSPRLSPAERAQVIAFLEALTGESSP